MRLAASLRPKLVEHLVLDEDRRARLQGQRDGIARSSLDHSHIAIIGENDLRQIFALGRIVDHDTIDASTIC